MKSKYHPAKSSRTRSLLTSILVSSVIAALTFGCNPAPDTSHDGGTIRVHDGGAPSTRATHPLAASSGLIQNRAPDRTSVAGQTGPVVHPGPAFGMPAYQTIEVPAQTLILYDIGGDWGWLGELYATGVANLVSHFGAWKALPARDYSCGDIAQFSATIYVGSSYDEPLPTCLLDDVLQSTTPVVWVDFNVWQLVNRIGDQAFAAQYGFSSTLLDTTSSFVSVTYKGRSLTRYADNQGILQLDVRDPSRATVLATAVRSDGTTAPWAVRSGNLTVVSEIPFSYMSEEDRVLAFEDMLFDVLAPNTAERHRAMLRLEDIGATNDPDELYAIADYLSSRNVPFGFGIIAEYVDPTGYYNDGEPQDIGFEDAPELVDAIHYMEAHGGTLVMHGITHQWAGGPNPYDGVSGDDTEFFRIVQNADETFDFVGPLPEDSIPWARDRILAGQAAYVSAGLASPTIFEFPHYVASANAYYAAAQVIPTRWERASYYSGVLGGNPIDHSRAFGQMFPYVVRDVYGSTVLPEDLGNIEIDEWHGLPTRSPQDLIRAADRNLVVRDGVASFFFHPFFPIEYLQQTVEGIQALGYQFVSPNAL